MHATAQVLKRNEDQLSEYERVLVFGQPEGETLAFLNYQQGVTFDYRVFRSLTNQLADKICFTIDPVGDSLFDAAIVFLPKAKEELELVLAYIAPLLESNASIYLVGEKKAGINSAAKKLDAYGDNSSKIDSAKHCQLWHVNLTNSPSPFALTDWMKSYSVDIEGVQLEIVTIPGVFSYGRLDEGTDLLLRHYQKKFSGRTLDFGCGSGVIGAYVAKTNQEAQLEMVDINLLAIECSKETLRRNKIDARVYPSDGLSDVTGRVNAILTNPPFHSGVKTEYSTTENFIRGALDKMNKHAPMFLVANGFLKYGPIMEQSFGSFVLLAENTKFKLYQVRR